MKASLSAVSPREFSGFRTTRRAAVAVGAVKQWLMENDYPIRVIFDVFLDKDLAIYREILDNV